ncbi:(Fe-S)-binding protein [Microaerobacter geothermalis]|uniref:(Fe-S)-binding protein n=1 Tax=Microaerobacter geothermalis TaxID=674972 RepID=UPI001F21C64B|nr:(Fe-S)-binding protein [Microaerobacter geothermalis]MCF6094082.1 (Fe-S)-binding protein [Microaerobacter geothermalis]
MDFLQVINLLAFLGITGYALYLFAHVVYSRYTFIKLGKKSDFKKDMGERINAILVNVFGQKKLLKDKKSGIMHVIMFYGFIIIQFGAIELIVKGLVKGWTLPVPAYSLFTLSQEIVIVLVIIAVLYAAYRRYIEKLPRLKRGWKASLVIWFIGILMLSELFSFGFERLWLGEETSAYAPFSSLITTAFSGVSPGVAGGLFYLFWWIHLLTLLTFLVYVPQSKHAHLIAAPVNVFLKRLDPPGKLKTIDFEDETQEEFGVGRIENFSQKSLIDLYACVECGRCTSMCPASGTGKMLSPMDLIVKMRDHLTEKGAVITSRTPWMPAFAFSGTRANSLAIAASEAAAASEGAQKEFDYSIELIGDVITEQELWACTTCRNCEDQCPVMNEHVEKIIDMRRYLVLTEGRMPAEAQRTLNNIERQGNPWGINRNDRIKWREGMEEMVPTVKEAEEFEYLFWVGSMGSYDNRNIKVSQAFAKILHHAGVKFAILGNEEKNSGDTARRLGNEFLFQQMAVENIETFQKYNVKKIVTCDPHAYNTLKHEYPEFGLEAEVYHHTEVLNKLLEEGKIKPVKEVKERITYHDSCYLGRYNNIYEIPRKILQAIPGVEIVEMDRNKENSMCCGAGGGMMWMEETEGTRVNVARTEQALAVNPTTIGSACPYCLTMMSDGTKMKEVEDQVKTKDIAEILAEAI